MKRRNARPVSHYPMMFPVEFWQMFWGRTRWWFESRDGGPDALESVDRIVNEHPGAHLTRQLVEFGWARSQSETTRRIHFGESGFEGRFWRPIWSPWPELRVRSKGGSASSPIQIRLGFDQWFYLFQTPGVVALSLVMLGFMTLMPQTQPSTQWFMIPWALFIAGLLGVVFPAAVYARRRRQRRDLIELGNLIQERLSAVSMEVRDEVDSRP